MAPHGACTGRAQGLAIGKARVRLSRPAAVSPGARCRAGVWLARPPAACRGFQRGRAGCGAPASVG